MDEHWKLLQMIDWAFQSLPVRRLISTCEASSEFAQEAMLDSGMSFCSTFFNESKEAVLELNRDAWVLQKARRVQQEYDNLKSAYLIGL